MNTVRKTIRFAVAAAAGALFLSSVGQAQDFKMRLAHELPLDGPLHRNLETFAADVLKATDGRVEITIHGAGTLGGDRALSEQVRLGGIELANLGVATQAPLSPQFSIEETPYAWDSLQQINTAFHGKIGDILSEKLVALGARPLSIHPFGFRHLTNNVRPVRTPEDIKGLKLRMAEVPIRLDTFTLLGTQPVPIAFPEVFTALQQGTVDGQENPLAIISGARFFEVQKHLSLTGHIVNMNWLVINEPYYASLPEDVRTALSAEAEKIAPRLLTEIEALESTLLADLKASGMEVVEDVDKDAFRQVLAPVYDKYSKVFEPDLWAALQESSTVGAQ